MAANEICILSYRFDTGFDAEVELRLIEIQASLYQPPHYRLDGRKALPGKLSELLASNTETDTARWSASIVNPDALTILNLVDTLTGQGDVSKVRPGLDGSSYELRLYRNGKTRSWIWWLEPDRDHRALAEIGHRLVRLAQSEESGYRD